MVDNLALATVNLPQGKSDYYATVFALSPKADNQTAASTDIAPASIKQDIFPVLFAPVLIFFVLFIAAFSVITYNRIWNLKRTVTSLVVALFVACIPYILNVIQNGTGSSIKATPDEIPRNLKIIKLNNNTAMVTWDTDADKIGAVRYVAKPLDLKTEGSTIIGNSGLAVSKHNVNLTNLGAEKIYLLEIYSGNRWFDQNGAPVTYTFK